MLPGVEHEYSSTEEFQEASRDLELSAIVELNIFANQMAEPLQQVHGYFGRRGEAAEFSVEGSDATWVEGVAAQLSREVEKAERWPLRPGWWALGFALAALIVSATTAVASIQVGFLPWWAYALAIAFCSALLALALALRGRLHRWFPLFAIVRDDYVSPARQLLNATPGIIKAVILIVATVLITKWLS